MTLATFNRYVDNVTGVSKTAALSGQRGKARGGASRGRHSGSQPSILSEILRTVRQGKPQGKHRKVAGHAKRPVRAFF